MLIRFRASNVLSFRDEFELSFLSSDRARRARLIETGSPGQTLAVLPIAAIFGANASGKTNVLAAMRWMTRAVTNSVTEWSTIKGVPRPTFALDQAATDRTSLFEVDLVLDGVRYIYGFEVSDLRVESEWLYAYPGSRRQIWFERDAGKPQPFRFPSDWLKGSRSDLVGLTRPNALFLTVAAQFAHAQLGPIHGWFAHNLWLITPGKDAGQRRAYTRERLRDPTFRARIADLLQAADLGIADIDVDTSNGLPGHFRLLHHSRHGPMPLDFEAQESLGTHAWFAFLGPMLAALEAGVVVLVDELDSSLHPALVAEVLRLFGDTVANPRGAQLICTVHDVSLLGSAHPERPLSREEVWVTEKRQTGESELYPLTDVRPRAQESLERGYLRGRYGGVPNLATNGFAGTNP